MLAQMETGMVFSCKVVSFDRNRKKGGTIVTYEEAVLVQREEKQKKKSRSRTLHEKQKELEETRKNPRHKSWYTRNIRLCVNKAPTSIIKKIHPPLVVEFNGQQIIV